MNLLWNLPSGSWFWMAETSRAELMKFSTYTGKSKQMTTCLRRSVKNRAARQETATQKGVRRQTSSLEWEGGGWKVTEWSPQRCRSSQGCCHLRPKRWWSSQRHFDLTAGRRVLYCQVNASAIKIIAECIGLYHGSSLISSVHIPKKNLIAPRQIRKTKKLRHHYTGFFFKHFLIF